MTKKSVLITGCSSGIGYLSALGFAKKGYKTFAGVRNIESQGSKELTKFSKKNNLDIQVIQLDVKSDESVTKLNNILGDEIKNISILINNAGYGHFGTVEETSIDEIKDQYETNVFGVIRLCKKLIPYMHQKNEGLIINISSGSGKISFPLSGVYSSSKFALEALSEALRYEVAKFGIKVVLVEPGMYDTDFWKNKTYSKEFDSEKSKYTSLMSNYQNRMTASARTKFMPKQNPQQIVDLLFKIAETKNPKLRYPIGLDAKVGLFIKRFLPDSVWEFMVRKVYKW